MIYKVYKGRNKNSKAIGYIDLCQITSNNSILLENFVEVGFIQKNKYIPSQICVSINDDQSFYVYSAYEYILYLCPINIQKNQSSQDNFHINYNKWFISSSTLTPSFSTISSYIYTIRSQ